MEDVTNLFYEAYNLLPYMPGTIIDESFLDIRDSKTKKAYIFTLSYLQIRMSNI